MVASLISVRGMSYEMVGMGELVVEPGFPI